MKIALNIEHFDPVRGGAEKYVYNLACEMAKMGHGVHVFCRDKGITTTPNIVTHIVPAVKWPKIISAISFIINSSKKIKRIPFDIVHVFGKNTYMNVFQPLGGSHRKSIIQNLMSIDNLLLRFFTLLGILISPKKLLFFFVEKIQMKNKDRIRIIAISKMVKDMFMKYYDVKENNIEIVYNGVDLEKYNPRNRAIYREKIRSSLGIEQNQLVLIFIANNFRLKGLRCAIKTLADLRDRKEKGNFKLLVVGNGKKKGYIRFARRLNVLEDIVFLGAKEDISGYLSASDICFQPTFYDPASLVVLEALASGLPVVTTKYNGMAEIIKEAQEGFVVDDPRDTEKLLERILFFKNPDNLNRCREAARRLAEGFTLERNYEGVLKAYKKVINEMLQSGVSGLNLENTPSFLRPESASTFGASECHPFWEKGNIQ